MASAPKGNAANRFRDLIHAAKIENCSVEQLFFRAAKGTDRNVVWGHIDAYHDATVAGRGFSTSEYRLPRYVRDYVTAVLKREAQTKSSHGKRSRRSQGSDRHLAPAMVH